MDEPGSFEQTPTEEPSEKAWINAIARDVEGYDSTKGIIVRDCGARRWYDLNGWVYLEDALEEQRKLDARKPENNPTLYEYMCFHGVRYEHWYPRGKEALEIRTIVDGHVCVFNRIGWKLS
jgi:hypothetical protein